MPLSTSAQITVMPGEGDAHHQVEDVDGVQTGGIGAAGAGLGLPGRVAGGVAVGSPVGSVVGSVIRSLIGSLIGLLLAG